MGVSEKIMIRDTFEKLKEQDNLRENLIQLKAELKIGSNKTALLYHMNNDYNIFYELLGHEDAKVRKNTALIMGELAVPNFLDKLYEAYIGESQLFVKSSYLTGIKKLNFSKYLTDMKSRLEELSTASVEDINIKHISEEVRILSELILSVEGTKKHTFTGYQIPSKVVLLTNRNHSKITLNQIESNKAKEFNAGVIVQTTDLYNILAIRTYSEILFMVDGMTTCSTNPIKAAEALSGDTLLSFLKDRHDVGEPFYFRIELKAKLELDKKSAITKKIAARLEQLTNRKLINSTSNYEFEIRLIENKEGNYNVLIKLYTLKDERFAYRKNVIPTSIQAHNAALIAALSKPYLKEKAQILDPFCGVGTVLIERNKLVPASTIYGLDIYEEAIEKAKDNTREANSIIHYINRNFFDFKHEYLFDEIITNMPRVMGHKEDEEIYILYRRFFEKAGEHMKKDGVLILYTHNRDYVRQFCNRKYYRVEEEFEISKKEGAYLFILRYLL
jgi:tRNA G10  N-methylase Trm11